MKQPPKDSNARSETDETVEPVELVEIEWVRCGRVGRPHGIRGAAHIFLDNRDSGLLDVVERVRLTFSDPKRKPRDLVITRNIGDGTIVEFEGITSRNEVETLVGAEVLVDRRDFPDTDDDEVYLVDFIGSEVVGVDGRVYGRITGFTDNRAQPLALVDVGERRPREMPFVPGIVVEAFAESRRVVVDPPLGLLEGDGVDDGSGNAS